MRILFSPLGLSYGSLFSAIVLTKPDHVVVITSVKAAENIPKVVEAAKKYHPQFTLEYHTISDPFVGFTEGRELAIKIAKSEEQRAESVEYIVNLAGGTTALQDAVQCLARALNAKEVAVIDRRRPDEQRQNPLIVGELIEVPPLDEVSS
jgi:hypothetical protein